MSDIAVVRHLGVDILHDCNCTHDRITLVACVICINEVALSVDYNSLGSCGTRVNAKEESTCLILYVEDRDLVLLMTLIEGILIFLALEDGIDPDDVRNKAFPVLKLNEKVGKVNGILAVSG